MNNNWLGDSGEAWKKQAIETETERQFVRALEGMVPQNASILLMRADSQRLIAMYAYRDRWSQEQNHKLGGMLDRARDGRLVVMGESVERARLEVDAVLAENRRVATAHALVKLSDALAARERFALLTSAPQGPNDETAIDATILAAAASLRLAGEQGDALGHQSLRELSDAAFTDLRNCGDGLVFRGLTLDPIAVAQEISRRAARLDAAVDARLAQFSALLRGPALAPRPFIGLVAAVAQADIARREILAAFGDRSADPAQDAASPALKHALVQLLDPRGGAIPVQWKEARRHVGGLLSTLLQIEAAIDAGRAGVPPAFNGVSTSHGVSPTSNGTSPFAMLNTAISMLQTLARHPAIGALGHAGVVPESVAPDPYWDDSCLTETAASFGVRFDLVPRRVAPLFGAMHRARLLAAVSIQMAQPALRDVQEVIAPAEGGSRAIQVDKGFHDFAYRRGELSLSVESGKAGPAALVRAAAAGKELGRPTANSLDRAVGVLFDMTEGQTDSITRLMSAVAKGVGDFVAYTREMPVVARWLGIPLPATVRLVHFDVGELPRDGYRLDVVACLETDRADTEARLSFAFEIDRTAHRVIRLIVPPDMRLLPAELPVSRNGSTSTVTTTSPAGAISGKVSRN